MRRRLYFLLPDVESAQQTANDLLLARIDDRHMHFLAKRGTDLGELNEANVLHKTDLMHGVGVGLALGGVCGLVLGAVIVAWPPEGTQPQMVAVLIAAVVGAVLGAWMSSMAGAAVPNSRLKQFESDIERGKVLAMVDVPYGRVEQIRALVARRHPEAVAGGQETRFPAFP
jgi:membrane protein DedA with SNARE-associated domain